MSEAACRSRIDRDEQLAEPTVTEILSLAAAADDTDGAYPISEHVVLRIRQGDGPGIHLLLRDPDDVLAGYAYVDIADEAEGTTSELVVHPLRRRRGHGRALAAAALAVAHEHDPRGRLRTWAHGDHPSAGALAVGLGFDRARVLLQLRRSLSAEVPAPYLPDQVSLRTFRPGSDDEAWLAVNARSFAGHPEQGRWTREDLRARMAEPWFDPSGFFLAVDDATGRLLGFHWTKVHAGEPGPEGAPGPIGEVYVVGVDPDAHGLGLGTALTAVGLRHLRERGLSQVMLYVDEANQAAMALYARLGFSRWAAHVQYRHG